MALSNQSLAEYMHYLTGRITRKVNVDQSQSQMINERKLMGGAAIYPTSGVCREPRS